MYNLKKTLFLNLTPRQKSALFSFLQGFVKKNRHLEAIEVLDKFLEEEQYYFKIEQTHFHFVIENFENEKFIEEILKFIKGVFCHIEFQEKQKPYIDKQKEFAKLQRKKAAEFKMSRELPSKKQLKYYEKLTKAHNLPLKNLENASKLDLRNRIMEIIEGNRGEGEDEVYE